MADLAMRGAHTLLVRCGSQPLVHREGFLLQPGGVVDRSHGQFGGVMRLGDNLRA
jgi:hypothetical protein